jgi:hypothetical protein
VADYISSNRDDFLPFLDEGDAIDFDKYCAGVKNSCRFGGRWGGDMEVRYSLLNLL